LKVEVNIHKQGKMQLPRSNPDSHKNVITTKSLILCNIELDIGDDKKTHERIKLECYIFMVNF